MHLLSIFHHHKGGHRSDVELLRRATHLVDIHLKEANILVLFTKLSNLGGNGLARSTPGGVEVNKHRAGRNEGLEDDLAVRTGPCQPSIVPRDLSIWGLSLPH